MKIPDMILQARKKERKGERKRKGKEKEKLVRWIVSRMAGIIWSFTQSIKNESEVAAVIEDQFYTVYSGISILNHGRRKRECGYKATKVAHKKNICICKKYIYICICKKREKEWKKKEKKEKKWRWWRVIRARCFWIEQSSNQRLQNNRRIIWLGTIGGFAYLGLFDAHGWNIYSGTSSIWNNRKIVGCFKGIFVKCIFALFLRILYYSQKIMEIITIIGRSNIWLKRSVLLIIYVTGRSWIF